MPPRSATQRVTRTFHEEQPGGMRIQIVQVQRGADWLELSRTWCRSDGIMVRQTFISLDPKGREVQGVLTQGEIKVGPISPDIFEVPGPH